MATYDDSTNPRSFHSSFPGWAGKGSRCIPALAGEAMAPGRFCVRSGGSGTRPTIKAALLANLPAVKVITATFAAVDAGDIVSGIVTYRNVSFPVQTTYDTSPTVTYAAWATEANAQIDAQGFTAAQSIAFTSTATTIVATGEIRGEDFSVSFSVIGDGTVTHATTGGSLFGPSGTYLGVVGHEGSYSLNGTDTIDSGANVSLYQHGPVGALAAAAAYTANQAIYVDNATGGITGTPSATTILIPTTVARATEQAASTTASPQGAALTLNLIGG